MPGFTEEAKKAIGLRENILKRKKEIAEIQDDLTLCQYNDFLPLEKVMGVSLDQAAEDIASLTRQSATLAEEQNAAIMTLSSLLSGSENAIIIESIAKSLDDELGGNLLKIATEITAAKQEKSDIRSKMSQERQNLSSDQTELQTIEDFFKVEDNEKSAQSYADYKTIKANPCDAWGDFNRLAEIHLADIKSISGVRSAQHRVEAMILLQTPSMPMRGSEIEYSNSPPHLALKDAGMVNGQDIASYDTGALATKESMTDMLDNSIRIRFAGDERRLRDDLSHLNDNGVDALRKREIINIMLTNPEGGAVVLEKCIGGISEEVRTKHDRKVMLEENISSTKTEILRFESRLKVLDKQEKSYAERALTEMLSEENKSAAVCDYYSDEEHIASLPEFDELIELSNQIIDVGDKITRTSNRISALELDLNKLRDEHRQINKHYNELKLNIMTPTQSENGAPRPTTSLAQGLPSLKYLKDLKQIKALKETKGKREILRNCLTAKAEVIRSESKELEALTLSYKELFDNMDFVRERLYMKDGSPPATANNDDRDVATPTVAGVIEKKLVYKIDCSASMYRAECGKTGNLNESASLKETVLQTDKCLENLNLGNESSQVSSRPALLESDSPEDKAPFIANSTTSSVDTKSEYDCTDGLDRPDTLAEISPISSDTEIDERVDKLLLESKRVREYAERETQKMRPTLQVVDNIKRLNRSMSNVHEHGSSGGSGACKLQQQLSVPANRSMIVSHLKGQLKNVGDHSAYHCALTEGGGELSTPVQCSEGVQAQYNASVHFFGAESHNEIAAYIGNDKATEVSWAGADTPVLGGVRTFNEPLTDVIKKCQYQEATKSEQYRPSMAPGSCDHLPDSPRSDLDCSGSHRVNTSPPHQRLP